MIIGSQTLEHLRVSFVGTIRLHLVSLLHLHIQASVGVPICRAISLSRTWGLSLVYRLKLVRSPFHYILMSCLFIFHICFCLQIHVSSHLFAFLQLNHVKDCSRHVINHDHQMLLFFEVSLDLDQEKSVDLTTPIKPCPSLYFLIEIHHEML